MLDITPPRAGGRSYLPVHVEYRVTGARPSDSLRIARRATIYEGGGQICGSVSVSVSDRARSLQRADLAAGGVVRNDRAGTAAAADTRGPVALRRRFDALRATPMRAQSTRQDNAALSNVELSSYPPSTIQLNHVNYTDGRIKTRMHYT